jgi:hypothetical protein
MSPRRRAIGLAATVVLLTIALVYALRPFTKTVFPGAWGECRAAVLSAPGGGDDEFALWAVTVGTDQMGFMPVFGDEVKVKFVRLGSADFRGWTGHGNLPDGVCATRARERLVTAAIFLLGAGGVLFFTLRRRRHAPD